MSKREVIYEICQSASIQAKNISENHTFDISDIKEPFFCHKTYVGEKIVKKQFSQHKISMKEKLLTVFHLH